MRPRPGFVLFPLLALPLAPGCSSLPTAAPPTAATAPTEVVTVRGNRIGYRRFGSGAPLLLTNRMRGTLDTWDPLFLDRLAEHNTVVTFDYPGVGYSTGTLPDDVGEVAGMVREFALQLGLRETTVLGWSWGGCVAQALLLEAPDLVTRAVLVGTAPPGKTQQPIAEHWKQRALRPVNDLADEEVLFFEPASPASVAAARRSHDRIYARPGVQARIPSRMAEFETFFTAAASFHADAPDRRTRLQQTRTPILIICGDHDPSVPVENWYPMVGDMPRAHLIVLPDSGHGPQHQYPELVATFIAGFLEHAGDDRD